jgi:hypothetical protein
MDREKLAKSLTYYAGCVESAQLGSVLRDAADVVAEAAARDAQDAEIERLISEVYE